ncbi:JmjC domain-containing protein [Mycobacterium sp. 134]|uniref:JmjC domain-containing protein n=1 Tax=Mycobacterium sp. 134 TaxID=3400425 RepID=UPI003AAEE247
MAILEVDPDQWRGHADRAPFLIRHNLLDHDQMTTESLARLTEQLPAHSVEHNYGALPTLHHGAPTLRAESAPADILRSPDFQGTWMAIKNVEQDPRYRELLLDCLSGVPDTGDAHLAPHNQQGFVFVSARHSVTPSHYDSEENFLLQLHGSKEITIGCWPDGDTRQRELEARQFGVDRYLPFLPVGQTTFHLRPGDGVYVPPNSPHFVEVSDEPSISFSVTFRTDRSDIHDDVVYLNARLRKLGLRPRPPGAAERVDRAKSLAARIHVRAMQWRT